MTTSYWLKDLKNLSTNSQNQIYDYIVIGAGIAGLSTAYWLEKKSPNSKIAVIDRLSVAAGASGRNAGFVTCGSALHFNKLIEKFGLEKAQEIWKFSEMNRELLLKEIIQENGDQVDYKHTGSCTVVPDDSQLSKFENLHKLMNQSGIDAQMIDEGTLHKNYAVKSSAGAIEYKHDGVIHPVKLLNLMASKLNNTDFILDEEVLRIDSDIVVTSKNTYKAEKTFVCLNGFVSQLLPKLKGIIKPQRGQIILTEPRPQMIKGPCYLTQHLCYFRQLKTGEILIGGFRNKDPENENTMVDQITDNIQMALEDFARTYFENASSIKINYRWSGIMGFSPDEQMMIGECQKNIYLMAGCSGHGMGLSFHASLKMVENSFGEKLPDHLDISRFSL